jgi:hypothetical protein
VNDHNEPLSVSDLEFDATIGDEDLKSRKDKEEYLNRFSEFKPELDMDMPKFKNWNGIC